MIRTIRRRFFRRDEAGFVAIEFVAGCGFLLIPVTLLCLAMPTWVERESLARTAAREAARVYVLSANHDAGERNAEEAVRRIEQNAGLAPNTITLGEFEGNRPGARGGSATANVTIQVPVLVLPFKENVTAAPFPLYASHREYMDLYRTAGGRS